MGGNSLSDTIILLVALVVVVYITWMLLVYNRLSTQTFKMSRRIVKLFDALKDEARYIQQLADAVESYDETALDGYSLREPVDSALAIPENDTDYYGIIDAASKLDEAYDCVERLIEANPSLQNSSRVKYAYARLVSFHSDFNLAKIGYNNIVHGYNRRIGNKLYRPLIKLCKYKEVGSFVVREPKLKEKKK